MAYLQAEPGKINVVAVAAGVLGLVVSLHFLFEYLTPQVPRSSSSSSVQETNRINHVYAAGGINNDGGAVMGSGAKINTTVEIEAPPTGIYYLKHLGTLRQLSDVGGNRPGSSLKFDPSSQWLVEKGVENDGMYTISNMNKKLSLVAAKEEEEKECVECGSGGGSSYTVGYSATTTPEKREKWIIKRVDGETKAGVFVISAAAADSSYLSIDQTVNTYPLTLLAASGNRWLFVPV